MLQTEIPKTTYKLLNINSGRDSLIQNGQIRNFLFQHLDQYGDSEEAIQKAIDYVFDKNGGHVVVQLIGEEISGVVVINETGMQGYIPENILVYIAVDSRFRGRGLGKELLTNAIRVCKGSIALHVERNNPARFLYERLGFTNPYLEMRLIRN